MNSTPRYAREIVILFLDFDGVVHHFFPYADEMEMQNSHFAFLPNLEDVLRDHPYVRIVISSDWRLGRELEDLRAFFSADIRARVIGKTGNLSLDGLGASQRRRREALD